MSKHSFAKYFSQFFLLSIYVFVTACGSSGTGPAGTPFIPLISTVVNQGALALDGTLYTGDTTLNPNGNYDFYTFDGVAGTDYQITINSTDPTSQQEAVVSIYIVLPTMLDNDSEFIDATTGNTISYGYYLLSAVNEHNNGTGDLTEDALNTIVNFRAPVDATYMLEALYIYELTITQNMGGPLANHPTTSAVILDDPFTPGAPINADITFTTGTDSLVFGLFDYAQEFDTRGTVAVDRTATLPFDFGIDYSRAIPLSNTNLMTTFDTWGSPNEAAGSVWFPSILLTDTNPTTSPRNPNGDTVTTQYAKDWPFINTLMIHQKDNIGSFGAKTHYLGDTGMNSITMGTDAVGDVTCTPPVLTGNPTLSATMFTGSVVTTLTAPIDGAATVNAYANRSKVDGFTVLERFDIDLSNQNGSVTTVGAGDAIVPINVPFFGGGAGVDVEFYIDIEIIDAVDAGCRSYYRATDPMVSYVFDGNISAATSYFHHQNDVTNLENRVNTVAIPVVTFIVQ